MKNLFLFFCLFVPILAIAQKKPAQKPEPVYTSDKVDSMPHFKGGDWRKVRFIMDNVKYPQAEAEAHISGIVYISFTVETDGSLSDIKAVKEKGVAPALIKEAIRVMYLMPNWDPGKKNGKPVRVQMLLDIKFNAEKI
jgi:protein TonB